MNKSYNKEVDYASLKSAASHYHGERGYCSVIAIAIATGCKFGKARSLMLKNGRQHGRGASVYGIHQALRSTGKDVTEYTTRKGFTLKNAHNNLPKQGTFLVYSSCHVTCVRDGVIQDWATDSSKRMQAVYQVQ